MKRFALVTAAAIALLAPTIAGAQGVELVYRHELRGMVAVPRRPVQPGASVEERKPAVVRTFSEEIAYHQAMAAAYRGTKIAQAAVHCDRLIAEAREARKQF